MWMSVCIPSIVNMHDAIVKNLIPNISNKGQIPLIPEGYRRPNLKIKHMTPSLIQKKSPMSRLDRYHISHLLLGHLMPYCLLKIRLRLKVCESCSSTGIVTHSFSRFDILAFALDGYSTSAGLSNPSNFSFPSLIKLWTLRLSALQSSTE